MARSTSNSSHEAGGRTRARRLFVVIAIVLSGIFQGEATKADDSPAPSTLVTVREEGGVYRVAAEFDVAQPASVARAVLTDYERIPRFMPDVKTSIVRERFPDGVLVEQEAVAHMMMFSKRIYLLLHVHLSDRAIRFRDSSGRSFDHYEGAWQLAPHPGGTSITYELSARPCFDVPEFLLKRLLKRDAQKMIDQLRTEIAARARQTSRTDLRMAPSAGGQ
jgi:ribosome-associated toxin RatA of RatAB toxin-antitoxin module